MFDPESISISFNVQIISVAFYLIIAFFTLASALSLYSLIRYGKNKLVIMTVCLTYLVVSLVLFFIANDQLHKIKF